MIRNRDKPCLLRAVATDVANIGDYNSGSGRDSRKSEPGAREAMGLNGVGFVPTPMLMGVMPCHRREEERPPLPDSHVAGEISQTQPRPAAPN